MAGRARDDRLSLDRGWILADAQRRGAHRVRSPRGRLPLAGLLVGAAALALLVISGSNDATSAGLVEMGFDPDRAQLITALVAAAIAAAAAGLVSGGRPPSLVVGIAGTAAFFGPVFVQETAAALSSSGEQGRFDPAGWVVALVTVATAGLVVAWASAVLAIEVRRGLLGATESALTWLADRRAPEEGRWRPLVAVLMLIVLAVAIPTFGNMVNYSPDVTMRQGGPGGIPLVGGGQPSTRSSGSPSSSGSRPSQGSSSPVPSSLPSAGRAHLVAGPFPGSVVTAGAFDPATPWRAWQPTGTGTVTHQMLPAPWTGGTSRSISFDVYLPPGYSPTARRAYPTTYLTPWGIAHWEDSIHIREILDGLMTSGRIPAQIVVFVSQFGAPYPASECADSFDGRQHLDTWIAATLVPWVDGHYRSIANRRGRSLLGYSEGAYCASALLLHHVDVFAQAAAMSGYYVAGPHDNQTINSWRVFGDNPTAKANASPIVLVDRMTPATRQSIFIALSGQPTEPFYGAQYRSFADRLAADGIPMALLPTSRTGHSWQEVRADIGSMFELLGGHLVATRTFA